MNDIFLEVNYTGDRAMVFNNGKLVADHFYYGLPWEIGLKKFDFDLHPGNLQFFFHPIFNDAKYLIDFDEKKLFGSTDKKQILEIGEIKVLPEYKAYIKLPE